MLTTDEEVIATKDDAPAENNCKKTIWLAPLKIIIEVAYVRYGPKPNSMPIAPKIIPKGITGIIKGNISIIPLLKIFIFDGIYLVELKAFFKNLVSNLQSL